MFMYLKNFVDWFKIKLHLDNQNHKPPLVHEGEIWWCRLGENVGVEISGKGINYTRPVIIHTKFSKYLFLVIPTTTKLYFSDGKAKEGNRFVKFSHSGLIMLACLSQIRVIDYRRIKNKLGDLDQKDFADVSHAFDILFSKNKSPISRGAWDNPKY